MNTQAILAQYESVIAQRNQAEWESTHWANLHENMAQKLSRQTSAAGKWESSSDAAEEACGDESKEVKGFKSKGVEITNSKQVQRIAISYANSKVPQYSPEKLDEYAALDINYDMMQATYDTLIQELDAQAETLKSQLGNATKDTGMLDS